MSLTRTSPGRPSIWLGDTVRLKVSQLRPNSWNVNKLNAFQFSKLLESIQTYGFFDPILVRRGALPDQYEIIGGEHRVDACKQLGIDEVTCVVMDVSDTVAKKISLIDNELHGQADPGALSALLNELIAADPGEVLKGLPYTDDILRSLTGFKPLPPMPAAPSSTLPGSPSLPAGGAAQEKWVERTYRMPESVAEVLDEALARARVSIITSDARQPADFELLEVLAAEYLAS